MRSLSIQVAQFCCTELPLNVLKFSSCVSVAEFGVFHKIRSLHAQCENYSPWLCSFPKMWAAPFAYLNCNMNITATVCAHDISLQRKKTKYRKWNERTGERILNNKKTCRIFIDADKLVKWWETMENRWKHCSRSSEQTFNPQMMSILNEIDVTPWLSFNYKLNGANRICVDNFFLR